MFRDAGLRVLAVDLDPQGNLSDYFDVPPDAEPTIGDVLTGRAKAKSALLDDIIPANLTLAEAELALAGKMGRELTLKRAVRDVEQDYDIVFMDCPPALGLLTVNALVAADYALLSSEAQYFALQGVEQALEVIELARDGLNPDLEWLGVLFNIADMRTVHSREAYASLGEHVGDKLLKTTVRQSIAYAESAERAVSILDHRPDLGRGLPRPGRRAAPAARRGRGAPRAAAAPRADASRPTAPPPPDELARGRCPRARRGCRRLRLPVARGRCMDRAARGSVLSGPTPASGLPQDPLGARCCATRRCARGRAARSSPRCRRGPSTTRGRCSPWSGGIRAGSACTPPRRATAGSGGPPR